MSVIPQNPRASRGLCPLGLLPGLCIEPAGDLKRSPDTSPNHAPPLTTNPGSAPEDSVSDITKFKVNCEGFCKKNKQVLCDDLSLNIELIGTNVKEDLSNYEIVELKKMSQSKLNEKELAHIIYTHN